MKTVKQKFANVKENQHAEIYTTLVNKTIQILNQFAIIIKTIYKYENDNNTTNKRKQILEYQKNFFCILS